jgi:hypothetical protein
LPHKVHLYLIGCPVFGRSLYTVKYGFEQATEKSKCLILKMSCFQIEKENIQVLLVDYGNLVGSHDNPVTHRDLRIPFHFGDVPIFATRLVLDYLVPVQPGLDYQWPELVLDALYEMVGHF